MTESYLATHNPAIYLCLLFGLDFAANFTPAVPVAPVAPPVVSPAVSTPSVSVVPSVISSVVAPVVAETLPEQVVIAMNLIEVTREVTPVVVQQEKNVPIVAVVEQKGVEHIATVGDTATPALQGVIQKPEDLLVDLKSLDLSGGLVNVLVEKDEVVVQDVIAHAAEHEETVAAASSSKRIDILKDLEEDEFECNRSLGKRLCWVSQSCV
ncbi:UNVERIFIED_CONTAM: hypothetical protein HDU68_008257 [Siphonaria sp. JEL0065]|nr:hypothetical protein HDU68_008257 [Siphonaria sp. JEL0065]